jgi:transcription antitermination factor NusG
MQNFSQAMCRSERDGWCVLYARHQHEKKVASILSGKGFQVFLPMYDAIHKWVDRNKRVSSPLFPGYVFFVDEADRRLQVLATPGVHTVIMTGAAPAVVPNEEIAAIRRAVESSLRVEPHQFLENGDLVRIMNGPLVGLEGIVSRKKDSCRLVLSIRMLGRSAAVEIDSAALERVHSTFSIARPNARATDKGHVQEAAS